MKHSKLIFGTLATATLFSQLFLVSTTARAVEVEPTTPNVLVVPKNETLSRITQRNTLPAFLRGMEVKHDENLVEEIQASSIPEERLNSYTVTERGVHYDLLQVWSKDLCPVEFNWYDNGIPVAVINGGSAPNTKFTFNRYDNYFFGMTGNYGSNYGYTWYEFSFREDSGFGSGITYYTWIANKSSVDALVG